MAKNKKKKQTSDYSKSKTAIKLPEEEEKKFDAKQLVSTTLLFLGAVAVAIAAYYIVYLGVVPQKFLSPVVAVAVLLIPLLMFVERFMEDTDLSGAVKASRILLTLTALFTATFFITSPYLENHTIFSGEFTELNQKIILPIEKEGKQELVLETMGTMEEVNEAYKVNYGFRIAGDAGHELLKGKFERIKGIVNKGKNKGKPGWFNHNEVTHRFTESLDKSSSLELYRLKSNSDKMSVLPIKVKLRLEPATWFMFGILIIPLILLAGSVDMFAGQKEKFPFLCSRITFVLIFSFLFSNTLKAGDIFQPIIFSLLVAIVASFTVSWLIPKLLNPISGFIAKD